MEAAVKQVSRFPAGAVRLPPSKSVLHRELICAYLAGGRPALGSVSEDIDATARCMEALLCGNAPLDCGESGSTLRFLIPAAAALGKTAVFTGRGRLLSRPLAPFLDELARHGVRSALTGGALTVSGVLQSGVFSLPGDISSQFVTGLLLALPLTDGDSVIHMTSPLESAAYVDLTLDAMRKSGVAARRRADGDFEVPGGQRYARRAIDTEGDYSQAAFFLVSGALGRDVACLGLNPDSKQGDRGILEILRRAGVALQTTARGVRALPGKIAPCDVDVSGVPDLVPPLAALFCFADGTSRLYNAARLRLKESDRLASVQEELCKLGARIEIDGDALALHGVPGLRGGEMDARGDHRIAMMGAVAAIRAQSPVFIAGYDSVRKSYPDFWKDFEVSA
jgi:3-phosphoshikimate 1-carboxyvinyltransferase